MFRLRHKMLIRFAILAGLEFCRNFFFHFPKTLAAAAFAQNQLTFLLYPKQLYQFENTMDYIFMLDHESSRRHRLATSRWEGERERRKSRKVVLSNGEPKNYCKGLLESLEETIRLRKSEN